MPQNLNYKNENKDGEPKTANERCKRRRKALTNSKRVRFSSLERNNVETENKTYI